MRRVVLAVLVFGLSFPVFAGETDILRGTRGYDAPPMPIPNWQGFYFGGQVGWGAMGANFGNFSGTLVGQILASTLLESEVAPSNWPTVRASDTARAATYGGFVGYNAQWDDAVLGIEANYNHSRLRVSANGSIDRITTLSDSFTYDVLVKSSASIEVDDFMTVRTRAGYAYGPLLPYLSAGVALGLATYQTSATVSYPTPVYGGAAVPAPFLPAVSMTQGQGKSDALIYGFSLGAGADWALSRNFFLRAEYEFIQFSQMKANMNTVRAGLGVKF